MTAPTLAWPAGRRLAPRPKYLSLMLMAVQALLAYRGTLALNIASNQIWVVVLFFLWQSVYAARPEVAGFDWSRMKSYLLLAFAVNALLSFYVEARLINTIRTGQVAVELLRPLDYLTAQLAGAIGAALVEGAFSAGLALGLGLIAFGLPAPASPLAAVLFPVSVALGFLVKFLISYLTGLLCFWTQSAFGLLLTRAAVTNTFSGVLIPLAFFPEPWRTLVGWLPFPTIVATPVGIYLGTVAGAAVWPALAVQTGWAVVLWLLARRLWQPASRSLTVHGG